MTESLTSNLSAELRNPAYNDESDGHVRLRAADEIDRLTAEVADLKRALKFYASGKHYRIATTGEDEVTEFGQVASEALKERTK